jgi:hypothetical protein
MLGGTLRVRTPRAACWGARQREIGAGPNYELVFIDRVLVTLVHLRTGLTHAALGVIYEVGSSTVGRAISEVRPLLAARGFAVPDRPGIRLRTSEDVFAYADAKGVCLRIDGMETQVRRPKAGRPGRRAFIGSTSKVVDRLEARGWVERRQNPADRRSSLLTLTDDGRRLVAAAEGTFSERLAELIADTPDAPPITAAAGALARLRSVLERDQIGTPTG